MTAFHHVSKPRAVSYLGRVCDMQEFYLNASKNGRRISVRRWRDTGEVELRAITGDGRTDRFLQLGTDVLDPVDATPEYVALRARAMADRYWS